MARCSVEVKVVWMGQLLTGVFWSHEAVVGWSEEEEKESMIFNRAHSERHVSDLNTTSVVSLGRASVGLFVILNGFTIFSLASLADIAGIQ